MPGELFENAREWSPLLDCSYLSGGCSCPLQTSSGLTEQLCTSAKCQDFFTTASRYKRLPQHICLMSASLQETIIVRTNLTQSGTVAKRRSHGKCHHPTVASFQPPTQDLFPFSCYLSFSCYFHTSHCCGYQPIFRSLRYSGCGFLVYKSLVFSTFPVGWWEIILQCSGVFCTIQLNSFFHLFGGQQATR